VDDADAVIRRAADAGGTVDVEPSDQLYGERSGSVRDPFGHRWNIGHSIEEVEPEEMQPVYQDDAGWMRTALEGKGDRRGGQVQIGARPARRSELQRPRFLFYRVFQVLKSGHLAMQRHDGLDPEAAVLNVAQQRLGKGRRCRGR